MYRATATILIAVSALAVSPIPPLAPTVCQVPPGQSTLGAALDDLTRQSGIAIDQSRADKARPVNLSFGPTPFWDALERTATAARHRVVVSQQGIAVLPLTEGARRPPTAVSGAFRLTAREATARLDFEAGRSSYDLTLDVHWEPKIHLFLIGLKPGSLSAVDAAGKALEVTDALGGRLAARGTGAQLGVRLGGVSRRTAAVGKLAGNLDVVGTNKFLETVFDLKQLPAEKEQDGVTVRLNRFAKRGNLWAAEIALQYPADTPEFESFQSWAGENQIVLRNPAGAEVGPERGSEVISSHRNAAVIAYYFPAERVNAANGDLTSWTVRYRTPGRIVEAAVPFTLEGIDLP